MGTWMTLPCQGLQLRIQRSAWSAIGASLACATLSGSTPAAAAVSCRVCILAWQQGVLWSFFGFQTSSEGHFGAQTIRHCSSHRCSRLQKFLLTVPPAEA